MQNQLYWSKPTPWLIDFVCSTMCVGALFLKVKIEKKLTKYPFTEWINNCTLI